MKVTSKISMELKTYWVGFSSFLTKSTLYYRSHNCWEVETLTTPWNRSSDTRTLEGGRVIVRNSCPAGPYRLASSAPWRGHCLHLLCASTSVFPKDRRDIEEIIALRYPDDIATTDNFDAALVGTHLDKLLLTLTRDGFELRTDWLFQVE